MAQPIFLPERAMQHLRKLLDASAAANARVTEFIDVAAAVLDVDAKTHGNFDMRRMAFVPVASEDAPVEVSR